MPPPIPIDKSPLIMAKGLFVFWNQLRTGLLPSVSNDRVVRWSKAATKVNQRVQTWQVLLEPTQPDSFAWIWNSVGKTSAETCQVLIWIGIGAYTARTASMDMKFDRQYLHGDLLGLNQAYFNWTACQDIKPGTQAFCETPPSSNLTGLTRAYLTQLACRDMKPVRQDFCGDLSGFIIYYHTHGHITRYAWLSQRPVGFCVNEMFFFHLKFLQQIGLPLVVIFNYMPYMKVWAFGALWTCFLTLSFVNW